MSLAFLAIGSAGLVRASQITTVPPRPASGPVFAAVQSTGVMSSSGLATTSATFLSDPRINKNTSVLVIDGSTGAKLVDRKSNVAMTPASTIKLVTAAAAIERVGAMTRFRTEVTQNGNTLTVVGGGDPTLTSQTAKRWRGKPAGVERPRSLDELATATAVALGPSSTNYVVNADRSFFPGKSVASSWSDSYVASGYVAPVTGLTVDFGVTKNDRPLGNPAEFAGKYFATALRKHGIHATYGSIAKTSSQAKEIARIDSATVTDIVERMLTTSNNTIAEYLAHHVGRIAGDASFEGSPQAVLDVITQMGINSEGLVIRDGSGLSHEDQVTARTLVDILYQAQHSKPQLWPTLSGLPIAGVSGTLTQRYPKHAAGRGYMRAKTGTLTGVVALAGTTVDSGGDLIVFAVMANHVADANSAEHAVDSYLQALAGCSCQ